MLRHSALHFGSVLGIAGVPANKFPKLVDLY